MLQNIKLNLVSESFKVNKRSQADKKSEWRRKTAQGVAQQCAWPPPCLHALPWSPEERGRASPPRPGLGHQSVVEVVVLVLVLVLVASVSSRGTKGAACWRSSYQGCTEEQIAVPLLIWWGNCGVLWINWTCWNGTYGTNQPSASIADSLTWSYVVFVGEPANANWSAFFFASQQFLLCPLRSSCHRRNEHQHSKHRLHLRSKHGTLHTPLIIFWSQLKFALPYPRSAGRCWRCCQRCRPK